MLLLSGQISRAFSSRKSRRVSCVLLLRCVLCVFSLRVWLLLLLLFAAAEWEWILRERGDGGVFAKQAAQSTQAIIGINGLVFRGY